MKILAIDTATEACSVGLYDSMLSSQLTTKDTNQSNFDFSRCDFTFKVCPQKQSQQILPMIEALLTRHNLKVSDLDAVAYARGPGSFTGVRIAASTVQGLALGADIPVIQVSTLAVMAQESFHVSDSRSVISAIDARMDEVYLAYCILDEETQIMHQVGEEMVVSPDDALKYIHQQTLKSIHKMAFVGTGFIAYKDVLLKNDELLEPVVKYPNAKYILPLACEAFKRGQTVSVENVQPVYVRDTVTWKKLPNKV